VANYTEYFVIDNALPHPAEKFLSRALNPKIFGRQNKKGNDSYIQCRRPRA
jgi:hypothetical protein